MRFRNPLALARGGCQQVGIWNSTGTLLGSVNVLTNSSLTDGFRYESISPINLTSGSTYILGAEINSPFSDIYFSSATVTTASDITFRQAARNNSSGGFSFPSTLTSNTGGRIGPNFQFTNASAVPEPLTILGAMTAAGFGAGFKRKLAKAQKDKKDA